MDSIFYASFLAHDIITGEINDDGNIKVCKMGWFMDHGCCWLHDRMMAHAHTDIDSQCFSVAVPQSCTCLDFWSWCR